jgi:hypothetical protein
MIFNCFLYCGIGKERRVNIKNKPKGIQKMIKKIFSFNKQENEI